MDAMEERPNTVFMKHLWMSTTERQLVSELETLGATEGLWIGLGLERAHPSQQSQDDSFENEKKAPDLRQPKTPVSNDAKDHITADACHDAPQALMVPPMMMPPMHHPGPLHHPPRPGYWHMPYISGPPRATFQDFQFQEKAMSAAQVKCKAKPPSEATEAIEATEATEAGGHSGFIGE
eukprot:s3478_g4.t1